MSRIHSIREGSGPVIVLSHALGCDLRMYDAVARELSSDFAVIRYDQRGHGQSSVELGPYAMAQFADDAAAVIAQHAGDESVVFAGTSLGGMAAQALASKYPERVRGIVVANSALCYDDVARSMWAGRIEAVVAGGVGGLVEPAMERWFSASFRGANPEAVEAARRVLRSCDAAGYAASCAAVMGIDFRATNATIRCSALVIDGQHDIATPAAMSDAIAQSIPNAIRATLNTGHLGASEDPVGFARLLREFVHSL